MRKIKTEDDPVLLAIKERLREILSGQRQGDYPFWLKGQRECREEF